MRILKKNLNKIVLIFLFITLFFNVVSFPNLKIDLPSGNFSLKSESVAFASSKNLVKNGDFSKKLKNWQKSEWSDSQSKFENVGNAAVIVSGDFNDARLTQKVKVKKNSTYKISANIKVKSLEKQGGYGAGICVADTSALVFVNNETKEFEQIELYVTTNNFEEMQVDLCFGWHGSLAKGTVLFQDVVVQKLEEYPQGVDVFGLEPLGEVVPVEENFGAIVSKIIGFSVFAIFVLYLIYSQATAHSNLFKSNQMQNYIMIGLVFAAMLARLLLVFKTPGHPYDTSCFNSWSTLVVEHGPRNFYTADFFSDYPPGYMYVLYVVGKLNALLGVTPNSSIGSMIVAFPAIIADIALGMVAYQYAFNQEEKTQKTFAMFASLLVLLNPVLAYNSAIWRQVDSVLCLAIVVAFLLVEKRKYIAGVFAFAVAVLLKPQALIVGPVFAMYYIFPLFEKQTRKTAIKNIIVCLGVAFAVIMLGSLPFKGTQNLFWIFERYYQTSVQYPYASVNAFNFFGAIGANWAKQDTILGFLTYKQWGMFGIFASFATTVWFAICARTNKTNKTDNLFLLAAFFMTSVFMFGHNMHERYSIPALVLLVFAFIKTRDRNILYSFFALCATTLINIAMVLISTQNKEFQASEAFKIGGVQFASVLSLIAFGFLLWTCFKIFVFGKQTQAKPKPKEKIGFIELQKRFTQKDHKLNFSKKDWLYMLSLTVVYTAIALFNLGTTNAPESFWRASKQEKLVIDLGQEQRVAQMWVYGGINETNVALTYGEGEAVPVSFVETKIDPQEIDPAIEIDDEDVLALAQSVPEQIESNYNDMYRWKTNDLNVITDKITLQSVDDDIWINEIVLLDDKGKTIVPKSVSNEGKQKYPSSKAQNVFDEQQTKPERPTAQNGMYFDELYHARTAYEHLHGLKPYENTHPPLGKVFIMIGISIFGMNPFGWRIVGTVFGIAMIPLMYIFAKRLFKKTKFAVFAAALLMFDIMHFVQTRIATIDVYGVFFILMMYYFMLQYLQMNFFVDGVKKTLKPLLLCGLFFGIGAASKWICLYAGAGLAVLFFASIFMRISEYLRIRELISAAERNSEKNKTSKAQKTHSPEIKSISEAILEKQQDLQKQQERIEPIFETSPAQIRELVEMKAKTENIVKDIVQTLLVCVYAFIILPVIIYFLSYIPYFLCTEKIYGVKSVLDFQKYMLNYHSGLTARHGFESRAWTWVLNIRPIWYYQGKMLPEGYYASIAAFGNPAVWWSGAVAIALTMAYAFGKKVREKKAWFITIAFLSQFAPWLFINRAIFIYHYFASVPFIILALAFMFKKYDDRAKNSQAKYLMIALVALCVALFIFFYPVMNGVAISQRYAQAMLWLKSWGFFIIQ